MESNVIQNDTQKDTSDFINAEKNDSSEPVDSKQNSEKPSRSTVDENEPVEEQTYQDILGSGDLMKKIVKPGASDDRPMKGEQIVINLVGCLEGKGVPFEEENNLEITLGDCEVSILNLFCINFTFAYKLFTFVSGYPRC